MGVMNGFELHEIIFVTIRLQKQSQRVLAYECCLSTAAANCRESTCISEIARWYARLLIGSFGGTRRYLTVLPGRRLAILRMTDQNSEQ